MHVGICGYPGSGKTTVFTALAPGGKADREVSFGNIKVPDARIDFLAGAFKPKKTTYAEVTFVDVGGGSKAGGAFPPNVLQNMRNADLLAHLESGEALRTLDLTEDEVKALGPGIQLLSMRPLITVFNLSEAAWSDAAFADLRVTRHEKNTVTLAICGAVEAEIAALAPEEQKDFLEGLGLGEPARNVFVREAYRLLDLISFLTAGADECRAWPIRRGISARKAAGKVHSDIERGFIRAEIYRPEDLQAEGTEAALKSKGKIRVEGKDSVMLDGDVVKYRFNV